MAYQIKCDKYPLLDFRDEDLILTNPKVKTEVNTVGEGSFTIYKKHPYYNKITPKSIFEISDEIGVIFRGTMTGDTIDFQNGKAVDLEGVMAFFNCSIVRPFKFPEDFLEDENYISAAETGNVVEFFLNWLIEQHNSQVEDFQKMKLGNVTVSDPNNYISRSNTDYANTWETIESKLFKSSLGGDICIRYEDDGNYIDYLADFELTNTQEIVYGENMLNLSNETDLTETYSAIIPIGAEIETVTTDEEGNETVTKEILTLKSLADGDITDDIVKVGDTLYSKKAVENYGWKYAPPKETKYEDVTDAQNLLSNGVAFFVTGILPSNSIEIEAVDLHFTDAQIRSFRIYRKVVVRSILHGLAGVYRLSKLEIDILNPQNTKITVGRTQPTMTGINKEQQSETVTRIEKTEKDIGENRSNITQVNQQLLHQYTSIVNDCEKIILSALENYVETSNYEEFKSTMESQLVVLADRISIEVTKTVSQVTSVDGDLQETKKYLEKHFDFTENGLIIKAGDNADIMRLRLDNDVIRFMKGEQEFGWWDGVNFHTGNIVIGVEQMAQFGNFAALPRSDKSLMWLKVGE